MIKKKAIIFDLDGTLWDSSEGVAQLWNQVVKDITNLELTLTGKDIADQMGKPMYGIGAALFPMLAREEMEHVIDVCCDAENDYFYKHGAILYPNLEETLTLLQKQYDLYIVSNCQDGYIEAFMHYHKLESYFTDIMSGGNQKPKGENIRLIMERNQVTEAVYVGDTTGDQESSVMAGIPFIYASYGLGHVEESQYSIGTFAELPALVNAIYDMKE